MAATGEGPPETVTVPAEEYFELRFGRLMSDQAGKARRWLVSGVGLAVGMSGLLVWAASDLTQELTERRVEEVLGLSTDTRDRYDQLAYELQRAMATSRIESQQTESLGLQIRALSLRLDRLETALGLSSPPFELDESTQKEPADG